MISQKEWFTTTARARDMRITRDAEGYMIYVDQYIESSRYISTWFDSRLFYFITCRTEIRVKRGQQRLYDVLKTSSGGQQTFLFVIIRANSKNAHPFFPKSTRRTVDIYQWNIIVYTCTSIILCTFEFFLFFPRSRRTLEFFINEISCIYLHNIMPFYKIQRNLLYWYSTKSLVEYITLMSGATPRVIGYVRNNPNPFEWKILPWSHKCWIAWPRFESRYPAAVT